MIIARRRFMAGGGGAALAAFALRRHATANGDDFFNNPLDNRVPLDQQILFIGNVKDEKGRYLDNAAISVNVTVPAEYGAGPVAFSAYTNFMGRYRTLDVLSVVASMVGADVAVDPSMIEITASKDGHKLRSRNNKTRARQKRGVFEVDFVLQRD